MEMLPLLKFLVFLPFLTLQHSPLGFPTDQNQKHFKVDHFIVINYASHNMSL
jgi:hypothetical protein